MKSKATVLLSLVLLVGCARENPIDALAARLSADRFFGTEAFEPIPLSASTRPQVIVERAVEQHHARGFLHQELEVREGLRIKGQVYTAVLIATNLGQEIVLVRFDESSRGWWSGVYVIQERKS